MSDQNQAAATRGDLDRIHDRLDGLSDEIKVSREATVTETRETTEAVHELHMALVRERAEREKSQLEMKACVKDAQDKAQAAQDSVNGWARTIRALVVAIVTYTAGFAIWVAQQIAIGAIRITPVRP